MKKGFVITWLFPPGNSSEGIVTYKLLKNSNFLYDVFTQKDGAIDPWNRKVKENELTAKNINVIFKSGRTKREWIESAVAYYEEHQGEYDFIMSRAMPPEAHEVALRIKKKHPEVKWIASFGDPLVRTPYIYGTEKQRSPHSIKSIGIFDHNLKHVAKQLISPGRIARNIAHTVRWRRDKKIAQQYKHLNDATFKMADILLFNNDFQKKHAFDGEHKDQIAKAVVLPHSYDPELYSSEAKKDNEKHRKVIFAHFGHLDFFRTPIQLLKAIRQLHEADSTVSEKVEFRFYGSLAEADRLFILDNKLYNLVTVHAPIQYTESLRLMQEADWLLAIDTNLIAKMPEYIFLPAKLIDYFGAGRNIFSITNYIGAPASTIKQVGGGKCVTFSADEIFMYLSKIIYEGYVPPKYDKKALEQYSARVVAKNFDTTVQNLFRSTKKD